jgi:hypothetical protein
MKVQSTTTSFLALLVLIACASTTTVEARTFQSSSSLAASLTKKALPLESELLKLQQQQQTTTSSSTTANADLIKELTVRGGDDAPVDGLAHRLKIGGYFAAWYALNVVYNSKLSMCYTNLFLHHGCKKPTSLFVLLKLTPSFSFTSLLFFTTIISRQQEGPQCDPCSPHDWFYAVLYRCSLLDDTLDNRSSHTTQANQDGQNRRGSNWFLPFLRTAHEHDFPRCRSCLLHSHCQGPRTLLFCHC